MVDSNSVANQALQMIGDNMPPVTGYAPTFDSSTAGQALAQLYEPCVRTIAKQFGWDFARAAVMLSLSGNAAPAGYAYEYIYPGNGVEILQIMPPTLADPNNPLPQNWTIGNNMVTGIQTKVIWSSLQNAEGFYNNVPQESTWDSEFQEAVVRLLSSELSMALFARPDSAEQYLQSGAAFEQLGESRAG